MKVALVCLSVFFLGVFAAPNDVPGGRIVGGDDAHVGQFPYQASIQYCLQGSCSHACGGAIIGALWVLSAAHCITQAPALGSYQVVTGIVDLDDDSPEREVTRVQFVIIHPEYEGGVGPHDLSIFRLATPLTFNNQVQPISLPDQDEVFEDEGIISGWGSTSGTDVPHMPLTLQYVQTPIVDPPTCKAALDAFLGNNENPLDEESNVCTGPLNGGVAICTGDSGGPLADPQGQTLIGIASWTATRCGIVGVPSVHIRVSYYTRWIRSAISG